MKRWVLPAFVLVLSLVVLSHSPVYAACTCYVDGQIDLHHNCAATTINLWVEVEDPETGQTDWVIKATAVVHDLDTFHFTVVCGLDHCTNRAELKSKGRVLAAFDLPGPNNTIDLGLVYDPDTCSRKKESAVPPPPP